MSLPSKVSIIIPVYNVEDYLSKCLDSCVRQTLYDIEIICVNDGSTDSSFNLLQKYAKSDERIKVISQENQGVAAARNVGLAASNSDWIMFLDPDDYLSKNACERVWLESQYEKTDVIIFGSDIFPTIPEVEPWYWHALSTEMHRFYEFNPYILFNMPGGHPFVWNKAFSSTLLNVLQVDFNEDFCLGEDLVFQFEVLPFASNFAVISDRLYNYRWYREGSMMSRAGKDLDYKMGIHLNMIRTITQYWSLEGLLELYGTEYFAWLLDFMVPALRSDKLKRPHELAVKLREIIADYDLNEYREKLKDDDKRLAKMLEKM